MVLISSSFMINAEEGKTSFKNIRPPAVASSFYPDKEQELKETIKTFLGKAKKEKFTGKIFGLMVPHAGYVYSGQVAAYAFKQLEGECFDTVVLIGMSHHDYFDSIAVYDEGYFQTPLGLVKIDSKLAKELIKCHPKIKSFFKPHLSEHSLEVEIPFLQQVLGKFEILPILMSHPSLDQILAEALVKTTKGKKVLFIASSDMSHYPLYAMANQIDPVTLSMIEKYDLIKLTNWLDQSHSQCDTLLCGYGAVFTLIRIANGLGNTSAKILKYANSGDVSFGDKKAVVGYGAVVFLKPEQVKTSLSSEKKENKTELLSEESKKNLLKIARETIEQYINSGKIPSFEIDDPVIKKPAGVFVTLKKHGELRGCIGYIQAIMPLAKAVSKMAIAASTEDSRFPPMVSNELKEIKIEITVLSPLVRIYEMDKIEIGRDGLYIVKGYQSGLLLPQVATEQGWNKEQFLTHTCYKAGLSGNAWKEKDTELYIFTGEIFHEK